jgi:hypothetical protein
MVLSEGVCLTWCSVVEDFVAFVATDDDAKHVPPRFVTYSDHEVSLLFNDTQPDWTPDGLRRIHAYKKAGLGITAIRKLRQSKKHQD